MFFNSSLFLGLFLVFYRIYIIVKKYAHLHIVYVILFSLFFYYKAGGNYFASLILSSLMNYYFAGYMHRSRHPATRKLLLAIGMVSNLGISGYLKYTNFLMDSFNVVLHNNFVLQDTLLPVGVSFYTLRTMSYTIDIYRREVGSVKSFLDFAFFTHFFPQLVAGPIVRVKDFIPQIYQGIQLTRKGTSLALFLIIEGLLKKAVIFDYISLSSVDKVFDAPNSYTAVENLVAMCGYTLQIYCDFSGHSDMAIGLALPMNFTLPVSFHTPCQPRNITEFRRHWYTSLSTWLEDYLYFLVGGNRKSTFLEYFLPTLFFGTILMWTINIRTHTMLPLYVTYRAIGLFVLAILVSKDRKKSIRSHFNQTTTMLLGGLWCRVSLHFIIWGALYGLVLTIHKTFIEYFPTATDGKRSIIGRITSPLFPLIILHSVAFCWIFFRSHDFNIVSTIIHNIGDLSFGWQQRHTIIMGHKNVFLLMAIGYVWHFFPQNMNEQLKSFFGSMSILFRAVTTALIFWMMYATASGGVQPFVYFQF